MIVPPVLVISFLAFACTRLAPPEDIPSARRAAITIRFDPGGTEKPKAFVEVIGLDPENLAALSKVEWTASRWNELLPISVGKDDRRSPSLPGQYRVVGDVLRFDPRYPFEPSLRHVAKLDLARLPLARDGVVEPLPFTPAAPAKPPPAAVVRVEPSGAVLPENLLKFYFTFSAPMSRGEVYDHVRLRDETGRTVDSAFLEIGEELWDASGTRLTLLLDPGRIKRGLRPREEDGPILESGKSYSLQIDKGWHDATGQPLREAFVRKFQAGPPDDVQPDPKTWKIVAPASATRDPLEIRFPEPLDSAMLEHALILRDPSGKKVAGKIVVGSGALRWSFRPDQPWAAGNHVLEMDSELEDLAGNSIRRPFEVDVLRTGEPKDKMRRVTLAVPIRAASSP